MTIIKLEAIDGFRAIESQSHRSANWMGEEWIEVPESLSAAAFSSCGYCDLVIEEGVVVEIIPTERPAQPDPEPTAQEDTDGLLVDLAYSVTLLELGLSAE